MKRVPGVVVLAGLAVMAIAIIGFRDVVVRGLLRSGAGLSVAADPTSLPPLPRFPYDSMEPAVRDQFAAAHALAERNPPDAAANGDLGNLFLAYGFHGLAVPCFTRAAELEPEAWWWRYRLGVALYERGAWEQASTALERVLVQHPDDVAALLYNAESSRRRNRVDQALAGYRRVIELAPGHARAWGGVGQVELRLGNIDAAAGSLAEALRLAPDYGPARYALGRVLRGQGRLDEATAELRLAEQQRDIEPALDPELARELASLRTGAIEALHRGIELARAGEISRAITLFEEAVATDPELAEAQSQLGAVLLAAGRDDAALPHLDRAVQLDPDFADARYNLGLLAHRAGRFDEAVVRFEQAIAIRPDHYDARLGLGTDLPRIGREAEAVEHLRRAVALRPDQPRPYKRLADVLSTLGDDDRAAAVLEAGVVAMPGDASIADRLAWLLATCPDASVRDPDTAVRIATEVCRRTGDREPRAVDTLAAALAAAGRYAEAVEVATRAGQLAGRQTKLAGEIALRLEAYRAGRAWIQPRP